MIKDDMSASSADASNEAQVKNSDSIPNLDVAPQLDANTQNNSAEPSAAVDEGAKTAEANQPKSLLDVVKDVVDPADAAKANSEDSPNLAKTESNANTDTDSEKRTSEAGEVEDAQLPFHKHPRFQQVIKERAAYRQELDSVKPDAEEWRAVRTYMNTNNLTNDEVAKGFEIMAAMKNDPLRGRELLSHYWNSLQTFAGAVLPQDLQKRVDEGEVTDEMASELAKRRNEAEFLRVQQQQAAERAAQQSAAQQQAISQQIIRGAVVDWESSIKTRDADYSVKQPFLMDKIRAAIAARQPRTPQEAVLLVESAYKEVNDSLKRFTPQRQAANAIRSETSSANVAPQPKSLRDAVRLAAAGQL
jgi:hypothetical protein